MFETQCKSCDLMVTPTPNPGHEARLTAPKMIATCANGHRHGYNPDRPDAPRLTQSW
ncbi:hypothetical protein [Curtobacterium flaccumfaciens]|uniref:hypothetical protein n=1 Tax=Curtobacterium flaccumfaciens TaxID=2035 RepID=UPI001BDE3090|nr:hypothetical protein [Curtobacterium flaccumfaciens]MBT1595912.1 hypothetical protein [Curtobacterium flaccumfaciens pv. flaccumfaciens]